MVDMRSCNLWMLAGASMLAMTAAIAQDNQVTEVPIVNASFDEGMTEAGVPVGWHKYGGAGVNQTLELVTDGEDNALVINDGDAAAEVGVYQDFAITGGENYRVTVRVRKVGAITSAGAYVQLRFIPSEEFKQVSLAATSPIDYNEITVYGTAEAGDTAARIYLYCHAQPTPKVMVDNVKVEAGVEMPPSPPPPPPPAPEPNPPQFETLREMHLTTALVEGGQAKITVVKPASGLYDDAAAAIAAAIERLTGVAISVVTDESDAATVPILGNLICLGNRSTNATISELYDRYYTLLDLKYPGPKGHVVRTLHDPFADGRNVIFVGGSDTEGVTAAARALVGKLEKASAKRGELSVGWLAEIKLGEGVEVPDNVAEVKIWEESVTYGSAGYFGWNVISKHMALYYMTGDENHLDEFMRLAFPDEEAIKYLEKMDGERIENKHDPLAGPYHYAAHMMILLWDMIEESPYFSDADRLKIVNAFSRQLTHRAHEGIYGRTAHGGSVGGRHGDWAATSLYVLARYFDKYRPDPIWTCALDSVKIYFSALEDSAWLASMNDHLFWYTSYYDPMIDYFIMNGDRPGFENGNFAQALKTQDILFTGNGTDWGVRASSANYLLRAAYLTGDGRFLFYLDRTGIDTDCFRLGQSFWPDENLPVREPTELLDTWTMQPMPAPMWGARGKPLPLENQFLWGAYRNTLDASGDFLLIKGHNGGGRNPYHTFVPLELRIAGYTLLKSYQTQALTSADGMVEPIVAMDSQLLAHDVLGQTATATGDVPKSAFCDWKRHLALRTGRWCLFVDDLEFRTDSENALVETKWQAVGASWIADQHKLTIRGSGEPAPVASGPRFRALANEYTCGPGTREELLSRLDSINTLLLKAKEPGVWVEMTFELDEPVTGEVFAEVLNYKDRGNVRLSLDGEVAVEEYNHHAQSAIPASVSLGEHELGAGPHRLRFEITGKRPESERMYGGLVGAMIRLEGAPAAPARPEFELHPSDPQDTVPGSVVNMRWRGPVADGQHRISFNLLGSKAASEELACYRVAENAAALAFPEPGLAVVGEYEDIAGELVIISDSHVYGRGVTKLAGLLETSVPIDIDWDFATGQAHVVVTDNARIQLAATGMDAVSVTTGRHVLEGVMPSEQTLKVVSDRLAAALAEGKAERERELATTDETGTVELAALVETATANIGGNPVASLTFEADGVEMLALAEGTSVHILAPDGTEARTLQTDGEIKCMNWWEKHRLLLVGCKDEKVIAFDENGARVWEFTSEMDIAVWEAAKQYWFKSALPGIYGLHTGTFLNGESQCFIGSACTLEIIDEHGKLVKRMPIFWGPSWRFLMVDGPGESLNLLAARWPNGSDTFAILNNETMKVGRGFFGVPAGHTMVGGWTALNRVAMEYVDTDGNGTREVVTATNGVWNRVTVFDRSGTALYNAQFGPGSTKPFANLRDMAVADLGGDGGVKILVATVGGLVVALDHTCERVWSTRTPTPPTQIEIVGTTVFVGCEGGQVVRMTGDGEMTAAGQAEGRIARMEIIGDRIMVATDKGEVKAFAVE